MKVSINISTWKLFIISIIFIFLIAIYLCKYNTDIFTCKWVSLLLPLIPYRYRHYIETFTTIATATATATATSTNKSPPIISSSYVHERKVSSTMKKTVASNQQWKCGLCHKLLDETYEVDHIIPLYKGGTNDLNNLMALDPHCHRKKTIRDSMM